MKPEVVEGARNLRAILTSDARPAILTGMNLSQEELMLRLCNDVTDADLEVKVLQERLRGCSEAKVAELDTALSREREISAELSKQVAQLRARDQVLVERGTWSSDLNAFTNVSVGLVSRDMVQPLQAFTPLAAALKKGKPKKKAKSKRKRLIALDPKAMAVLAGTKDALFNPSKPKVKAKHRRVWDHKRKVWSYI